MIEANSSLFKRLIRLCKDSGLDVAQPNSARWVKSTSEARRTLKSLTIAGRISFGRFRHLAWLQLGNQNFIAAIGFGYDETNARFPELDNLEGFDVCILSELPVQPSASASAVLNVVCSGSESEYNYSGHESYVIHELFPAIRIYEVEDDLDESTIWSSFMLFCVDECSYADSWIGTQLAESLGALASLNVPSLPYEELCRAVIDLDPRSLYMGLYRCIEATYAYDKATNLASSLGVSTGWYDIAAILEAEVGWRPQEAASLNATLKNARDSDLERICACLGVEVGQDLCSSAGRAIYKLRNEIVHYRPQNKQIKLESIHWNNLCDVLVVITLDVFHRAYG